jgi:hypothetical protein
LPVRAPANNSKNWTQFNLYAISVNAFLHKIKRTGQRKSGAIAHALQGGLSAAYSAREAPWSAEMQIANSLITSGGLPRLSAESKACRPG